ncbi:TIGR04086 family membrane protein [Paenibacillus larvae]|nr:TIGR04086 family membrane protein [Paenibacillus larvae]MDT2305813.1 TIGR04086 family membrane protein [Paenibacillus larvae]
MEKGSRFRFSSPLLSGLLASCLTMLVITILSSLFVWMSSAEESSLGTYSFLNYLISMFIGGWTAGKKAAGRAGITVCYCPVFTVFSCGLLDFWL